MSTARSRAEKVRHNTKEKKMFKKTKNRNKVIEKPTCKKCGTEFLHVYQANRGRMERRCECNLD